MESFVDTTKNSLRRKQNPSTRIVWYRIVSSSVTSRRNHTHSLFVFVVHPLHPKGLEEKRSGFLKDLFSLRRLVDVVGNGHLLPGSGAGYAGVGGIVEEVTLGEFFRHGPVEIRDVQDNALDLGVLETLDAQGVLEDEPRSLELPDDLRFVGGSGLGGRRQRGHTGKGGPEEEGGRENGTSEELGGDDLFFLGPGHGFLLLWGFGGARLGCCRKQRRCCRCRSPCGYSSGREGRRLIRGQGREKEESERNFHDGLFLFQLFGVCEVTEFPATILSTMMGSVRRRWR